MTNWVYNVAILFAASTVTAKPYHVQSEEYEPSALSLSIDHYWVSPSCSAIVQVLISYQPCSTSSELSHRLGIACHGHCSKQQTYKIVARLWWLLIKSIFMLINIGKYIVIIST